jgi:hypothetical protein
VNVRGPLGLLSLGLVVVLEAACGDPNVPSIADLRYDGQAKDSPLVILMSVDFEDADGDLSAGTLQAFIDAQVVFDEANPPDLLPLFLRDDVPEDATSGTFGFVLELSFADGILPPSGTAFAVGARLTDGAGQTSPTHETRLQVEY